MNKSNLTILLILVGVVSIFITANLFYAQYNAYRFTFPADLTVSERAGFNLDTDGLHFSYVTPKTENIKTLNITSPPFTSKLEITAKGPIAQFLRSPNNGEILNASTQKEITIIASLNENAVMNETYTGTVSIKFKKVS
ncbi:MAG: hypothetical protein D6732_20050 [Methanobacteriota archaeon]|nr:MAG: hypothetical protein D6732_20050 [Euryarchaeota archaeon]